MTRTPLLLLATAGAALCSLHARGSIDLLWEPTQQSVALGEIVEIQLRVRSDGPTAEPFDSLDAVISWDPAFLELIGTTQARAGASFFLTGFLPDFEGVNDDLTDGDAIFTALGIPGQTIQAPPAGSAGLVITTFRFLAAAPTPATTLSLIPDIGPFVSTTVYLAGADVTGSIDSVATVQVFGEVPPCPADGSCFEAHGNPGCDDTECCNAVCDLDPACCQVAWDADCVAQAAITCAPPEPPAVTLSEIRIDQPGADNDEYFELAGAASTALDGATYLIIGDGAGGSGVIEAVVDLSGEAVRASGFFVAAEETFTLGTANLSLPGNGLNFENGDNVTHLVVFNFTGSDGQDLDTNDDGVLDITPWDSIIDSVAFISPNPPPPAGTGEHVYSSRQVGPEVTAGGTFTPGHIYVCVPEGEWAIGPFDPVGGDDTPGAVNADCPICLGDLDGDGDIDGGDLGILLAQWGGPGSGDLDGSGTVDGSDLGLLLAAWGPCPE